VRTEQGVIQHLPRFLLLVALVVMVSACSFFASPAKQQIAANFTIQIKDPVIKDLAAVTELFEIDASGEFNAGNYTIENTPLKIDEGTKFKIQLSLPIKNPSTINVGTAAGMLWTSHPLQAHGAPLPKLTKIQGGKVTAEIDLIPTLGTFLCNMLQHQVLASSDAGDVKTMIKSMDIDQVVLSLRPGALLRWGDEYVHILPKSKVELLDLTVDQNLNYAGQCLLDLNFSDGFLRLGERFDCTFAEGSAKVLLTATRANSLMTLSLADPKQKLTVTNCVYKFGKNALSTAHCANSLISLKELHWREKEQSGKPTLHLNASMDLTKTIFEVRHPKYSLWAQFRGNVPAFIELDRGESTHRTIFFTVRDTLAETTRIEITRPTTDISLSLNHVTVGPISFSKTGDLEFSLETGTAGLLEFKWTSRGRSFRLTTAPPSTLSITSGMALALSKQHGEFHGSFPLSIKLGNATLDGSAGALKLSDLTGQLLIEVDKEVKVDGDTDFSIAESEFLGKNRADVKVRGLTLTAKNGQGIAKLKNCSIVLPQSALISQIREQLPAKSVFDVHEVVLGERKWRYKNALIERVIISNIDLENLSFTRTNQAAFCVAGDVEVQGSVDKGGILAVIDRPTQWQKRQWLATTRLTGTGTVSYKFLPKQALADSVMDYHLALRLPIPDQITLDWSRIGSGLLERAEKAMIVQHLKDSTAFQDRGAIPLKFDGQFELFSKGNKGLKSIKVQSLTTKPCPEGTEMDFVAEAFL
jgi:hypothetical protein